MDIKNFSPNEQKTLANQPGQSAKEPFIWTMAKDIELIRKKGPGAFRAWAISEGLKPRPTLQPAPAPAPQPILQPVPRPVVPPAAKPAPQPAAPLSKPEPPEGLPIVEPIKDVLPKPKPAQVQSQPIPPSLQEIAKKLEPKIEIKKPIGLGIGLGKETKKEPAKEKELKPLAGPAPRRGLTKQLIIIFVAVLAVALIGGFIYWWNYLRPAKLPVVHYECQDNQCVSVEGEAEDICQSDADCQIAVIPEALIPTKGDETIELFAGQENLLIDKLKSMALESQELDTLWRVLIKSSDPANLAYLDLKNLVSALGIIISEDVYNNFVSSENYTLFSYKQEQGNRLGLVIALKNNKDIFSGFNVWEKTMADDLKPLLLREDIGQPASQVFQDNVYQDVSIRYLNFPKPDLSIDYAVIGNKLIITSSRASMYAAIDALLTE